MSQVIQFIVSRRTQILAGITAIGALQIVPPDVFALFATCLIAIVTFVSPDKPSTGAP